MSKLNLNNAKWIDLLFEGRNKAYGAYDLRSNSATTTTKSFFIAATIFSVALASPLLYNYYIQNTSVKQPYERAVFVDLYEVELPDLPFIEETVEEEMASPPPMEEEATKSVRDQIKFTEPVVVEAFKVTEELATIEELILADPSQITQAGDEEFGEIKVNEATGTADKGAGVIGGTGEDRVYVAVERLAQPPGGLEQFYKTYARKYNAPDVDEGVKYLRLLLTFVVEKDGNFTNVRVLRDPGFGAGKEAIRVLRSMPKWSPAQQQGRPVRSQFSLPVTIQIQ